MGTSLNVDDLAMVRQIAQAGSIGAAARRLLVSQPSLSNRLGRLERRLGVTIFERGTRGARATVAGQVLIKNADHILGHLDRVVDEVRAASGAAPLRIGCFHGLADSVLPLLDAASGARPMLQYVDHGATLVEWVAEGALDAAVVSIAGQVTLPPKTVTRDIGRDEMIVFVPAGAPTPSRGRRSLKGLSLPTSTYDMRREELTDRITALGGTPRFGATVTATLRMARLSRDAAIVPRSAAYAELRPGEEIKRLPFHWNLRLSLVTRPDPPDTLLELTDMLTTELGLAPRP